MKPGTGRKPSSRNSFVTTVPRRLTGGPFRHPCGGVRAAGAPADGNLNGLFDTLGNVWEWCWDLLDPARYDAYRVFRGGGYADDAWSVRASTRRGGAPRMHQEDVGFRVARGGFDGLDAAQGWSAAADRERVEVEGPLPPGWTPKR